MACANSKNPAPLEEMPNANEALRQVGIEKWQKEMATDSRASLGTLCIVYGGDLFKNVRGCAGYDVRTITLMTLGKMGYAETPPTPEVFMQTWRTVKQRMGYPNLADPEFPDVDA